jgi:hypothetical protein
LSVMEGELESKRPKDAEFARLCRRCLPSARLGRA